MRHTSRNTGGIACGALGLVFALVLALGLAGCAGQDEEQPGGDATTQQGTPVVDDQQGGQPGGDDATTASQHVFGQPGEGLEAIEITNALDNGVTAVGVRPAGQGDYTVYPCDSADVWANGQTALVYYPAGSAVDLRVVCGDVVYEAPSVSLAGHAYCAITHEGDVLMVHFDA